MKKLLMTILFLTSCNHESTYSIIPNYNPGPQGLSGKDGTQINIVQFCPNVSSHYPLIFPEIGFCINNKIYAVYSANDGFMAEIVPGYYWSNAIGSICNFTVKDNCEIVQ